MQSQPVSFRNPDGHTLSARLDLPAGEEPIAYALFAHCFTCSKNTKATVHISRALNQGRIAVLRFDFTGLGESEGEFSETTFSSNIADLVAAARFLEREHAAPMLLVGHSLGGAAVLRAAAELPSVTAVATIGAPFDPAHVTGLFAESLEEIAEQGEATVPLAGRSFTVTRQFVDDIGAFAHSNALAELRRALLIMHSPVDEVVPIDDAAKLYTAARHPKSFVSLDRADHLLTDNADSQYAGAVLAAWASRYIESPPPAATIEELIDEDRVVARTGREGFCTDITTRGHALVADEPITVGGSDLGPTPYDLLSAALGACTTMTLRMYADRKGWPLEEASVRLRHRKVHAQDEARVPGELVSLDHIERELHLVGELDAAQRQRLLEIANRCPVHRTLEVGVKIETTLRDTG